MAGLNSVDSVTMVVNNSNNQYLLKKADMKNTDGKNTNPLTKGSTVCANSGIDEFVRKNPNENKNVEPREKDPKTQTTTSKKIGVGLASLLFSGLGQAVNGQWGKALGYCIGEAAAAIGGFCLAGPFGSSLGIALAKILSINDAVKNA